MLSLKGIFLLLILFSFVSCAHENVTRKETSVSEEGKDLSVQRQQEQAFRIFNRILEVRRGAKTLEEAVRKTEPMYLEIINEYPDAPIAQESCLRLIELYLRDYNPPAVEKAEEIYRTFQKRYNQPFLKDRIEKTFTRFYYANRMWDRIIELNKKRIRKFINTGRLDDPYYLLVFSDARYYTGKVSEAVKGYRWIIQKFPQSHEAKLSEKRLELILREGGGQ